MNNSTIGHPRSNSTSSHSHSDNETEQIDSMIRDNLATVDKPLAKYIDSQCNCMLFKLPPEIIVLIANYCEFRDLINISLLCKISHAFAGSYLAEAIASRINGHFKSRSSFWKADILYKNDSMICHIAEVQLCQAVFVQYLDKYFNGNILIAHSILASAFVSKFIPNKHNILKKYSLQPTRENIDLIHQFICYFVDAGFDYMSIFRSDLVLTNPREVFRCILMLKNKISPGDRAKIMFHLSNNLECNFGDLFLWNNDYFQANKFAGLLLTEFVSDSSDYLSDSSDDSSD